MNELIQSVCSMERAQQTLDRRSISRTGLLKTAYNNTCVCQGEWLQCAKQILCNNDIQRSIFADAVITLLAMGRGKGRYIYILRVQRNVAKHSFLTPYELFITLSFHLRLVRMRG